MTELQRWHHPSYEERWTNYGCICRFLKGIQHGWSHQDSWKKNAQNGFPKALSTLDSKKDGSLYKWMIEHLNWLTCNLGYHRVQYWGQPYFIYMQMILMTTMTGRHFDMQTKRPSWSTVPLQIWTLMLENWIAPYKPLKTRSSNSNLLLNAKKTKQMMIYTEQMSRVHTLEDQLPQISANGKF